MYINEGETDMTIKICTACDGTGHGGEFCERNRYFGCEECDGFGTVEVETEDDAE